MALRQIRRLSKQGCLFWSAVFFLLLCVGVTFGPSIYALISL